MTAPGFMHGHGASAAQLPTTLGALTSAASLSVVLATDYTLPVAISTTAATPMYVRLSDGTSAIATLPVSVATLPLPTGAATETTLAAVNTKLAGTIAVSAASLPLPTGAATSALQTTGNTSLGSIDTKLPASLGAKLSSSSLSVVLAADQAAISATQSGTWTITGIGGTISLPTGAATETTLAALSAKHPATLGQKAMAASMAVTIASDQTAFPTSVTGIDYNVGVSGSTTQRVVQAGRAAAFIARNDYSSVNVTTGAYVTLVASTSAATTRLRIFDSSGSALKLATGAAASEVDILYIPPGGMDAPIEVNIPTGTRLSLKAADSNATSGQILVTAFA